MISPLFVTGSLFEQASGTYSALIETAKELATRDCFSPAVVGSQEGFRCVPADAWDFVPAFPLRKVGPYSMHLTPGLWRWLERNRQAIDLVSLQSLWQLNTGIAFRWCVAAKVPYMITLHGVLNQKALQRSRVKKILAQHLFADRVLANAACLHALNEAEYEAVRSYGLRGPVCVIPNAISVKPLGPKANHHVAGWHPSVRICVYLGRLHPVKGLDTLIRSWSALAPHGWGLVLIGPDTNGYQANLKSLASGPGKIFFAGPQFGLDKEGWLRAADFCVLPSTTEGFPMAALEYMAHAKPVVMTKACNMPELAMVGAALQADGGEESLRSCLSAMMALSDAERADMGQQGLRLAMDRYTWSRVVDELAEVYAWILGKRGIPPTIRLD